jgi:hypothetical protein
MLNDERRNNFTLRISIDNITQLIQDLEKGETPSSELILSAKNDVQKMVDAITNYHARFKEVLETVNHIKEISDQDTIDF